VEKESSKPFLLMDIMAWQRQMYADKTLASETQRLFFALSLHSNKGQFCWVSVKRLRDDNNFTRKKWENALEGLEEAPQASRLKRIDIPGTRYVWLLHRHISGLWQTQQEAAHSAFVHALNTEMPSIRPREWVGMMYTMGVAAGLLDREIQVDYKTLARTRDFTPYFFKGAGNNTVGNDNVGNDTQKELKDLQRGSTTTTDLKSVGEDESHAQRKPSDLTDPPNKKRDFELSPFIDGAEPWTWIQSNMSAMGKVMSDTQAQDWWSYALKGMNDQRKAVEYAYLKLRDSAIKTRKGTIESYSLGKLEDFYRSDISTFKGCDIPERLLVNLTAEPNQPIELPQPPTAPPETPQAPDASALSDEWEMLRALHSPERIMDALLAPDDSTVSADVQRVVDGLGMTVAQVRAQVQPEDVEDTSQIPVESQEDTDQPTTERVVEEQSEVEEPEEAEDYEVMLDVLRDSGILPRNNTERGGDPQAVGDVILPVEPLMKSGTDWDLVIDYLVNRLPGKEQVLRSIRPEKFDELRYKLHCTGLSESDQRYWLHQLKAAFGQVVKRYGVQMYFEA
jgi:antitoxin component of RelBE/YafQ-DinJ toxin-antitoxin module